MSKERRLWSLLNLLEDLIKIPNQWISKEEVFSMRADIYRAKVDAYKAMQELKQQAEA